LNKYKEGLLFDNMLLEHFLESQSPSYDYALARDVSLNAIIIIIII
jgi:hypothetical protein